MTIEVDDVIRLPCGLGIAQHLGKLGKGRRAQHLKLEDGAGLGAQALEQATGDGAEGHIVATRRPTNHQQDANNRLRLQRQWRTRHCGSGAHKCLRVERQHPIGIRVAQQLPRQGGCALGIGDNLNAHIAQAAGSLKPHTPRRIVGREEFIEQLNAYVVQACLNPGSTLRMRLKRVFGVLLDVPREVALVLFAHRQFNNGTGGLACAPFEPL